MSGGALCCRIFPFLHVFSEIIHYMLVYGLDKKKKVAKISLDDQILLFIVQREAIVDITGTL